MLSLAAFIYLVVIPIWSAAAIIVRWIEAWGAKPASEGSGYLATPDEIAHVIVFVASANASYMTGASIPADGGMLAA